MCCGAEDIFELPVLEYTRRAAVIQNGKCFKLIGDRWNGQAITRRNVTQYGIDFFALNQVAEFLNLLGGTARFVDHDVFDIQTTKTLGVIRCRQCIAFVHHVDKQLATVQRRNAKAFCSLPRQKGDDADLERIFLCRSRPCQTCHQSNGA